jgi:hypothetical protein
MNPTKAAAILTLIVAIGAAGYLIYQATVVRAKYEADVVSVAACATKREATTANWEEVQSKIELLKAQGKYKEALDFAKQHAEEKPFFVGECGQSLDLQPPTYALPAGISVVSLIASLALFGAAKSKW